MVIISMGNSFLHLISGNPELRLRKVDDSTSYLGVRNGNEETSALHLIKDLKMRALAETIQKFPLVNVGGVRQN